MFRRWLPLRMLWTALLALVLAAPQGLPAAAPSALPDWLAASLCRADPDPQSGDHQQPGQTAHVHCVLCLTAAPLGAPPAQPVLLAPSSRAIALTAPAHRLWAGPGAARVYASRAPPRLV